MVSMTYQQAVDKAQSYFNRREYEQFILPIIYSLSEKLETEKKNYIKDRNRGVLNAVLIRARSKKFEMVNKKPAILLEDIEEIIKEEFSKEI